MGFKPLTNLSRYLKISNASESANGSKTKALQKQLEDQSDFINIAAHELRAPISPILFNAEMLQNELGKEKEELRIIIRNAYRLQYLAQNILDVARIESRNIILERSTFNLTALISEVQEESQTVREKERANAI